MHNILNNNKIRYFLRNNIRINLALKPAEKDWYKSSLPDNTYELYFSVPGFIQDTEYLKYIVNLFDVFLDKLTEHGIASSIADDGILCA